MWHLITRIEPVLAFSAADSVRSGNPLFGIARQDSIGRRQLLMAADQIRADAQDAAPTSRSSSSSRLLAMLEDNEQEAQAKWDDIMEEKPVTRSSSGDDPFTDIRSRRGVMDYSAPPVSVVDAEPQGFAPAGLTVWGSTILKTSWDQSKQYGSYGSNLYNIMTPSNRLAGCGPVAVAQVLYYHSWPSGITLGGSGSNQVAVQQTDGTFVTNYIGYIATYTNAASAYAITNMHLQYKDTSDDITWTNVSSLMADVGVAAGATYGTNGTSTTLGGLQNALTNVFKMPRAVHGSTDDNMGLILNLNIMAKKPVVMLFNTDGENGHIAVVDGLALSDQATAFYHLNLGWGEVGENTAWYNLPNIIAYNTIAGYIYNIMTNGSELVVGRVTSASTTNVIEGVTVVVNGAVTNTTDAYGAYGVAVDSGVNTVEVSKVGFVTQTYVVTNATSTGNTPANDYKAISLVQGDDMTFSAQTYSSNIVLTWSDPTNSYYPKDVRIIATTNSGGSDAGYTTFWTNAAMPSEWFFQLGYISLLPNGCIGNWDGIVTYKLDFCR